MAQEQSVLPKANVLLGLAGRPAEVIQHPTWTAARQTALALVATGPCRIVLLGPPGSGKTTLLRDLATTLRQRRRTVCLLDVADDRPEVEGADVVLVDEANRVSAARLDELSRHGGRTIILAGLPAWGKRFEDYPGVTVVRLAALSPDEACAFLAERLTQLRLPVGCLTESAWARLVAHGRGVPRVLIALLGLSLFVAGEDDARQVTGAHVEEAVAIRGDGGEPNGVGPAPTRAEPDEPDIPEFLAPSRPAQLPADGHGETRNRRRARWTAALVAVCLFAAVGALLIREGRQETNRTQSPGIGTPATIAAKRAAPVAPTTELTGPKAPPPAAAENKSPANPNAPPPAVAAPPVVAVIPALPAITPPPTASPPSAATVKPTGPVAPQPVRSPPAAAAPPAVAVTPAPPAIAPSPTASSPSVATVKPTGPVAPQPAQSPPAVAAPPVVAAIPAPPAITPPPTASSPSAATVKPTGPIAPQPVRSPPAVAAPPVVAVIPSPPAIAPPLTASPPSAATVKPTGPVAPRRERSPPARAVATNAARELPRGAFIHFVLIYPRGDQAAAQRGMDLARKLRSDGFGVGDPFPVPPREARRGISYYFAQDEHAAREIERRLGDRYGQAKLVRLPPNAGLPRPGTIEIALGRD